jgi:hypothetical protein
VYRSFAVVGVDVCGVRNDGTLWCWGLDFQKTATQVGQRTSTFTPVGGTDRFTSVAPGCGMRDDGQLSCWWIPPHGDGQGSVTMTPTRARAASDYTDFAVRYQSVLALHTGGKIDAPGHRIDATTGWTQVSPNSLLSCAIDGSSSLFCWGVSVDGTQPPAELQKESGTDWLRIATVQDSYPWACGLRGSTPGGADKLWVATDSDPAAASDEAGARLAADEVADPVDLGAVRVPRAPESRLQRDDPHATLGARRRVGDARRTRADVSTRGVRTDAGVAVRLGQIGSRHAERTGGAAAARRRRGREPATTRNAAIHRDAPAALAGRRARPASRTPVTRCEIPSVGPTQGFAIRAGHHRATAPQQGRAKDTGSDETAHGTSLSAYRDQLAAT